MAARRFPGIASKTLEKLYMNLQAVAFWSMANNTITKTGEILT